MRLIFVIVYFMTSVSVIRAQSSDLDKFTNQIKRYVKIAELDGDYEVVRQVKNGTWQGTEYISLSFVNGGVAIVPSRIDCSSIQRVEVFERGTGEFMYWQLSFDEGLYDVITDINKRTGGNPYHLDLRFVSGVPRGPSTYNENEVRTVQRLLTGLCNK